ncbi:hypothetical protein [Bradyrhizobium guangzhouense]|uniref:Lipopolysaccharide biosynthesis protein n=1 Tax=Bradyrhizobium guangzhouense TaxID=1325095 RepID=A0AAE6CAJ4_9BRAD|nr:hypothetical protein [Bradyrhizobium guangzhouense]QAU48687.1 hypothetical protein XH91_27255 [Bradyrhizobium guangzhouense]RXH09649.1 hypothetical protein EAS56_25450 [Bradyrhizobium guangzhouense]
MARLSAVAGYIYQSATAIVLIFAISHLLGAADYTSFSLALASSQLLCVLMFEWLQLAGLRFLAAADGHEAARLRWSLLCAGLLSALALVLIGACASKLSRLSPDIVALGLSVAMLQGFADLYFLTIRLCDRLGLASCLLALRASAVLGGAVAGAAFWGTAEATLIGIASGQAAGLAAGLVTHRARLARPPLSILLRDWSEFCRYGLLAAGASVIHLSVPVLLRFIIVSRLGATGASAGFSIALDLLQRPFGVLNAAIHTISYPEVVQDFERGGASRPADSARRMFEFMVCTTVVLLGGLIGFIPDAAHLLLAQDSLDGFLATAPMVALFYFLHLHLQSTVALVPHLEKLAIRLVVVATTQLILVAAASALAAAAGLSPRGAVASASAATVIVIVLALGPTVQYRAVPRAILIVQALAAAMLIGSLASMPIQPLWLAAKIVIAGLAAAIVAWRGDFLMLARHSKP